MAEAEARREGFSILRLGDMANEIGSSADEGIQKGVGELVKFYRSSEYQACMDAAGNTIARYMVLMGEDASVQDWRGTPENYVGLVEAMAKVDLARYFPAFETVLALFEVRDKSFALDDQLNQMEEESEQRGSEVFDTLRDRGFNV